MWYCPPAAKRNYVAHANDEIVLMAMIETK